MEKLLTLKEAADKLNISLTTMRRYVRADKIKATKFDRVYRIQEGELERFIEEQKERPGKVYLTNGIEAIPDWNRIAKRAEKLMKEQDLNDWRIVLRPITTEDLKNAGAEEYIFEIPEIPEDDIAIIDEHVAFHKEWLKKIDDALDQIHSENLKSSFKEMREEIAPLSDRSSWVKELRSPLSNHQVNFVDFEKKRLEIAMPIKPDPRYNAQMLVNELFDVVYPPEDNGV